MKKSLIVIVALAACAMGTAFAASPPSDLNRVSLTPVRCEVRAQAAHDVAAPVADVHAVHQAVSGGGSVCVERERYGAEAVLLPLATPRPAAAPKMVDRSERPPYPYRT